jgi:hypothetical protein
MSIGPPTAYLISVVTRQTLMEFNNGIHTSACYIISVWFLAILKYLGMLQIKIAFTKKLGTD